MHTQNPTRRHLSYMSSASKLYTHIHTDCAEQMGQSNKHPFRILSVYCYPTMLGVSTSCITAINLACGVEIT